MNKARSSSLRVLSLCVLWLLSGCVFSESGAIAPEPIDASLLDADRDAGADDADRASTCARDQRVEAGACVSCGDGETRPAGDRTDGGDTECAPIVCERDERVQDHRCVACEEGELNFAGDDASGPDTECVLADACAPFFEAPCDELILESTEASLRGAGDRFGAVVALDGDRLAVGAPGDSFCSSDQTLRSCSGSGAVYLFERDAKDQAWERVAYIKEGSSFDEFGASIALDGDRLVVGAPGDQRCAADVEDANKNCWSSGAVYIFERNNKDVWIRKAYLKSSQVKDNENFGYSIAYEGGVLAIGAPVSQRCISGDKEECFKSGTVYIFEIYSQTMTWGLVASVQSPAPRPYDRFGHAVALQEKVLAVGAPTREDCKTLVDGGLTDTACNYAVAAYTFEPKDDSPNIWEVKSSLLPNGLKPYQQFGHSIALRDEIMVVSASGGDACAKPPTYEPACRNSGFAYVFERNSINQWVEFQRLQMEEPQGNELFGLSVAIEEDYIVIGSGRDCIGFQGCSFGLQGAGHLFGKSPEGRWVYRYTFKSPHPKSVYNIYRLGASASIAKGRVVLGAPRDASCGNSATCENSGEIYTWRAD